MTAKEIADYQRAVRKVKHCLSVCLSVYLSTWYCEACVTIQSKIVIFLTKYIY